MGRSPRSIGQKLNQTPSADRRKGAVLRSAGYIQVVNYPEGVKRSGAEPVTLIVLVIFVSRTTAA